jgi:hypothetical protein
LTPLSLNRLSGSLQKKSGTHITKGLLSFISLLFQSAINASDHVDLESQPPISSSLSHGFKRLSLSIEALLNIFKKLHQLGRGVIVISFF